MSRTRLRAAVPAAVVMLLLAGCSAKHWSALDDEQWRQGRAQAIDLEAFLDLPDEDRAPRIQMAERAARVWRVAATDEDRRRQRREAPGLPQLPGPSGQRPPFMGDVIDHLDLAVGLDPARADLWYALGLCRDLIGDQRAARIALRSAWDACERLPQRQDDPHGLRRDIAVLSAWIERDDGRWDAGLSWLDRAETPADAADAEMILLRGLLLAGRGDHVQAMRLARGIPAVPVPVTGLWRIGLEHRPTIQLQRWLQAEVWLRRGRPDLAWHALGELPLHRPVPLPHRFWQDLGLYAEITGNGPANWFYAKAYNHQPHRAACPARPLDCDPVIRDRPRPRTLFLRCYTGALAAGSPFAHAASLTMRALAGDERRPGDRGYLLALDALSSCVRRDIFPDEARALRGRLRFSRGHYNLAERDLTAAHRRFARSGEAEPMTSYLLGLIALGRERHDRAETLFVEAVAADSLLAGAWSSLGVARLQLGRPAQARAALDRAVSIDPHRVEARYNRGLLRAQSGDLAGGLDDLALAGRLDPQNMRIGTLIQHIRASQRDDRPFLPLQDQEGRRHPLAIDLVTSDDGVPASGSRPSSGERLLSRSALFDELVAESRLAAIAEGFGEEELARLADRQAADPSPAHRKMLAVGRLWLDQRSEALRLLASPPNPDRDRQEAMLSSWLQRDVGESGGTPDPAADVDPPADLDPLTDSSRGSAFDGFLERLACLRREGADGD